MKLVVEVEGESRTVSLPHDGSDLAAFLSFASMRGFGAQHPLIALAERLQKVAEVAMGPLTTFYDATVEDVEDREKLELAWQDAAALAESASAASAFVSEDEASKALIRRADMSDLPEQMRALADAAREAGTRRIRLSYAL